MFEHVEEEDDPGTKSVDRATGLKRHSSGRVIQLSTLKLIEKGTEEYKIFTSLRPDMEKAYGKPFEKFEFIHYIYTSQHQYHVKIRVGIVYDDFIHVKIWQQMKCYGGAYILDAFRKNETIDSEFIFEGFNFVGIDKPRPIKIRKRKKRNAQPAKID